MSAALPPGCLESLNLLQSSSVLTSNRQGARTGPLFMICAAYFLTLLSFPFVGEWELLCITLYNLMLFINEHCICLTLHKGNQKP